MKEMAPYWPPCCACAGWQRKGDTPADTAPPDAPAQAETGTGGEAAEDSVEAEAGVAEEDISAAEHYVNNLPLESQVAQMFFARCPRPTRRYSPVSTISAAISCSAATLRGRPRRAWPRLSNPIRMRRRPPC